MSLNNRDVTALANAIYAEARNQSRRGKVAVAHTLLNRATAAKVSVEQAVYARGQISGLAPGNPNRAAVASVSLNNPDYDAAVQIASQVLSGQTVDPTNGATYYHTNAVSPDWSKDPDFAATKTIGDHVFYTAPVKQVRAVTRKTAVAPVPQNEETLAAIQARAMAVASVPTPAVRPSDIPSGFGEVIGKAPPSMAGRAFTDYARAQEAATGPAIAAAAGKTFGAGVPVQSSFAADIAYGKDATANREKIVGAVMHWAEPKTIQDLARVTNNPRPDQNNAYLGYSVGVDKAGKAHELAPADKRTNHIGKIGSMPAPSGVALTNRNAYGIASAGVVPTVEQMAGMAGVAREMAREHGFTAEDITAHGKGGVSSKSKNARDKALAAEMEAAWESSFKNNHLGISKADFMREGVYAAANARAVTEAGTPGGMQRFANGKAAAGKPAAVSPARTDFSAAQNAIDTAARPAPAAPKAAPATRAVSGPSAAQTAIDMAARPSAPQPAKTAPAASMAAGRAAERGVAVPDTVAKAAAAGNPAAKALSDAYANPISPSLAQRAAPVQVTKPAPTPARRPVQAPPAVPAARPNIVQAPAPAPALSFPNGVPTPPTKPDELSVGKAIGTVAGAAVLGGGPIGPAIGGWLGDKIAPTAVRRYAEKYIQAPKDIGRAVEAGYSSPDGALNSKFDTEAYWRDLGKQGSISQDSFTTARQMVREQAERKASGQKTWGDAFGFGEKGFFTSPTSWMADKAKQALGQALGVPQAKPEAPAQANQKAASREGSGGFSSTMGNSRPASLGGWALGPSGPVQTGNNSNGGYASGSSGGRSSASSASKSSGTRTSNSGTSKSGTYGASSFADRGGR